jgi:RES domain-containing protein
MPPRRRSPSVVPWSGLVFRATTYDVPLWVSPNRRDGRWNRAGGGCTQYMCLDPEAPYAELMRCEDLRTEAEGKLLRTFLWQLRVDEGAVVDYSTFEQAEAAGFPAEALIDDDHERCRAEAEWLVAHNVRGLLSPSAALPGSVSLTLFGARVEVAWATPARLASMVPVQRLAEGPPPTGLVARTRFYGQPHRAFEELRAVQRRLFP